MAKISNINSVNLMEPFFYSEKRFSYNESNEITLVEFYFEGSKVFEHSYVYEGGLLKEKILNSNI